MSKTTVKKQSNKPSRASKTKSISSEGRLQTMLKEAEEELVKIEPEIKKLQAKVDKLNDLKLTKQKLITLKLSLKSILNNYDQSAKSNLEGSRLNNDVSVENKSLIPQKVENFQSHANGNDVALFLPDKAFEESAPLLKRKNSLNYEIFRAIVFSGGQASTEQIRDYLISNNVEMPGSGKSVREVPLTDISSRANYLVRRGVVAPADRGVFVSNYGWENPSN